MKPTESSPQSAILQGYFPADWDIRRWGKAYVKPAVAHVPVKRICTGSFLIMKTSPRRLPKYFYRTKIEISVLFLTPSFWSQPHPWFPSVHTSRRYQNLAYTFLLPEGKKDWWVPEDWTVPSGYVSVELIIPRHNNQYHEQQQECIEHKPSTEYCAWFWG